MADSSRTIMTDAGFALEARTRAGQTKIEFTRASISTADHFKDTDDVLAKLTVLDDVQQDGQVTDVQVIDDTTVYVQVDVNQAESKADYQMRSAALYAKDDDGTEVLYGVTVLQDPVFVHKDADGSYLGFGINTTVGRASNVVVVVDPANMVTQQVFESTMKNYYTKAEVDAKFVTDDDFASKLPKNIATTDAANTFAKSQTLAGGATDGKGNAYATTKDVATGLNNGLSTKVNTTDMRKPASDVAGIEEVNAKQDKIAYTPADDSKVVHSTITQLNSTDMNTFLTAGFYRLMSGTNGMPNADAWTIYQVIPLSGNNGIQLAYGTNNTILGMRSWNNGYNFTNWVQFADDSKVAHNSGNEDIGGQKTFDTAPIDKTTGNPYITKSDVTTAISAATTNMPSNADVSPLIKGVQHEGADLNNETTPGSYFSNSKNTNGPSIGGFSDHMYLGWTVALVGDGSVIHQTAFKATGDLAERTFYARSGWGPWKGMVQDNGNGTITVNGQTYTPANDTYAIKRNDAGNTVGTVKMPDGNLQSSNGLHYYPIQWFGSYDEAMAYSKAHPYVDCRW